MDLRPINVKDWKSEANFIIMCMRKADTYKPQL